MRAIHCADLTRARCKLATLLSAHIDKPRQSMQHAPMELYVLRHAIALSTFEAGVSEDSERPLSEEGRDKMKRIASAMKTLGVEVDLILSSPYVRARETAEIAHLTLKSAKFEFSDALASGQDNKHVLAELRQRFPKFKRIMVVGHEPDLSTLITRITCVGRLRLEMKKAGLAKIEITDIQPEIKGNLDWLLPPKVTLQIH
jgi:phosphohistidine phosphatase